MNFDSPQQVEQVCYEMRLSDFPRGLNRSRINDLFNGFPPYAEDEVKENNIAINVNFLEATGLAHDARSQFYQAFLKPGKYFNLHTDFGPRHKRTTYNTLVTAEMNRIMKESLFYLETYRSKFALNVLHGIGPSAWETSYDWCPHPLGIEDVGIPAKTLLTMKNLPFFYLYRSFTAPELIKLTRGSHVDEGWNKPMVEKCLEWIDREMMTLMGSNWPEVWAPEKAQERVKGDGGFYCGDQVPTIDTFDFYFFADDGKESGWRRRIILDSWSAPGSSGKVFIRKEGDPFSLNDFLYTSKKNNFAEDWRQIVSFTFADLSAYAPFQYHSVRSLGFLLYAVCHLQNRMRCKFNESVFEALMMYFRVKTMDEAERVLKVNLINRGFLDESLQFIPAQERFQVNANLVELGLRENAGMIQKHVSSYVANNQMYQNNPEPRNKLQVMAELNATTTLVSSGLLQAYAYQNFENQEITRRFFRKNSDDVDVIKFQARCLNKGLPEQLLAAEMWTVEPERTLGAGNKTMEMAVVDMLMQARNLYDPEPQRQILRDFTLAVTDDPGRAQMMVPEQPVRVTDAVHDAQLAAGVLMQGLPVALKTGMDHIDYVETLLQTMAFVLQQTKQQGQMADLKTITGLQNMGMHIQQHIAIIAQNKAEAARVKKYGDALGKLMNEVKALGQRLAQMMKAQGQQGGGADPKAMAKAQEIKMMGDVKRQTMKESRAQRAAERQVEFEKEMQRDAIRDQYELKREELKLRHEMFRDRRKADQELASEALKAQQAVAESMSEHAAEMQKTRDEASVQTEILRAKAKAAAKPKKKSE
jgi:hypothetical protein